MRLLISIGLLLSIFMLVCGDYIGSNTNYHQHGFPSVGSSDYRRPNDQGYPSVPLADHNHPSSNIYTHGFPSVNDLRGNPNDYRGNPNDRRPNSIYTHGFPSINDLRGNQNTGYPNNGYPNTGYPNQDRYGNNYPRGPHDRPSNSRDVGGFGGSSYNRPSDPSNYDPSGTRGSFNDPNMQTGYSQYNGPQIRTDPGYPQFNTIHVGLSRFGLFNSNRPNYGPNSNGPYGPVVGSSYPNRYTNANGTGNSILEVCRLEGNTLRNGNKETKRNLLNRFTWHR